MIKYNEEIREDLKFAVAIAKADDFMVFARDIYECGYGINIFENGKWSYDEEPTAERMMKRFSELARSHNVKKCLVSPEYLSIESLKEIDRKRSNYLEQEAYDLAMMASAYGDDSMLRRYERRYTRSATAGDYSPSNPWDAPGMSIRDFI